MLKRKAQDGGGAAILVAIILLLIIVYVLFIPPAEREKLLNMSTSNETGTSGTTTNVSTDHNKTLLSIHPGKISFIPEQTTEHELPNVNLYTNTEGIAIKELNSLSVKTALFTDKKANLSFTINDLANTKNVLLSFNVLKYSDGELIIKLNGNEIFNKGISSSVVEPVKLPSEFLRSENIIEIEASGTGMVFWKMNEFILENIKITADITLVSAAESKSIFVSDQLARAVWLGYD